MTDEEYAMLKNKVYGLTNIDLDCYKSQQMRRRLTFFIERTNAQDVITYCKNLERDNEYLKKLRDFLTINVTEFFRDDWAFSEFKNNVIPLLAKTNKKLNIWSAGCSNGGEPYSIAILLFEITARTDHRILGTDVDELSLLKASSGGPYATDTIKNLPQDYRERYFTSSEDKLWITPKMRNMVRFQKHNLLADPFEKGFDLICCRNVTIYFTEAAKNKLNYMFHNSLNDDGILFIGATEFMTHPTEAGFKKISNCFYQKIKLPVSPDRHQTILQTV